MATNSDLPTNQRRALDAMLSSPSVEAAARVCGLSSRQLWRYLADDRFKSELQRRRGDVLAASTTGLTAMSQAALDALSTLLSDSESDSVKARVATSILELMRKSIELDDVLQRLEALEGAMNHDNTN